MIGIQRYPLPEDRSRYQDRIAGAGRGDGGVLPCEPGLSAAGRNRIKQQGKEGFTDNGLFPASLVRIPFSDWHTGLSKKGRYKCSDPGYSIILVKIQLA